MTEHPIARCPANDVEAWVFPFFVALAQGMEPAFLYLEDHVYNLEGAELEAIGGRLVKISSEEDLGREGFERDDTGIWLIV